MKKAKKLPTFSSEQEENIFWQEHDSSGFIDWSKAKKAYFPELKPSTHTISLRLPENLLNDIKIVAHKKDIPYQSFMKVLLSEAIEKYQRKE